MQALRTVRHIASNPGLPLWRGMGRYALWQARRCFLSFPFQVPVTEKSHLLIERRSDINGCVCLAVFEGTYDYHNMNFLRFVLSEWPEQVVFDIGANIGVYSLLCSEQAATRVVAFEPHPATAEELARNLESNGRKNVRVIRKALSDREGVQAFTDEGGSPVNRLVEKEEVDREGIKVPICSGISFCEEEGMRPSIIKLDVEGHEVEVLRGFKNILDEISLLLVEENAGEGEVDALLPDVLIGPCYVDYARRRIGREKIRREDAIYVHREFAGKLREREWDVEF